MLIFEFEPILPKYSNKTYIPYQMSKSPETTPLNWRFVSNSGLEWIEIQNLSIIWIKVDAILTTY